MTSIHILSRCLGPSRGSRPLHTGVSTPHGGSVLLIFNTSWPLTREAFPSTRSMIYIYIHACYAHIFNFSTHCSYRGGGKKSHYKTWCYQLYSYREEEWWNLKSDGHVRAVRTIHRDSKEHQDTQEHHDNWGIIQTTSKTPRDAICLWQSFISTIAYRLVLKNLETAGIFPLQNIYILSSHLCDLFTKLTTTRLAQSYYDCAFNDYLDVSEENNFSESLAPNSFEFI